MGKWSERRLQPNFGLRFLLFVFTSKAETFLDQRFTDFGHTKSIFSMLSTYFNRQKFFAGSGCSRASSVHVFLAELALANASSAERYVSVQTLADTTLSLPIAGIDLSTAVSDARKLRSMSTRERGGEIDRLSTYIAECLELHAPHPTPRRILFVRFGM